MGTLAGPATPRGLFLGAEGPAFVPTASGPAQKSSLYLPVDEFAHLALLHRTYFHRAQIHDLKK